MHWHWLIVVYLFLGGLGAGAYLTSFAAEKGWLGKNSSLKRAGYYIAAPIIAIGTVLLVFDLGQGLHKPWLLYRLIFNFGSVMTWGVYILSGFIGIGLIKAFITFKKIDIPAKLYNLITWSGAGLALATCMYTGLLISVIEAVPIWSTNIMPILFMVSALSTGLSLTALLAPIVEKGHFEEGKEGQAHIILIAAELLLVAVLFGTMLSGANGPVGQESAHMVVSGVYSLVFWGYFIGLGLVFPLLVSTIQHLQAKKAGYGSLAAKQVAATVEKGHHSYMTIVSDISVLVGGFALRALIILAALPVWDGYTIP